MPTPADIFIGRETEMVELTAALEDVFAGQGRLIMLTGEPGIGKTRTAQQLAGIAERRGGTCGLGKVLRRTGSASLLALDTTSQIPRPLQASRTA